MVAVSVGERKKLRIVRVVVATTLFAAAEM